MKIVVTGGAGYIGCRLIEQLLKNSINHKIICIDWLHWGIEPILNIIDNPRFELHNIDICKPEVEPILRQADAIIHLAGIVGYPACNKEPDVAYAVNVEGTKRVVDSASDKKFVYVSTGSVYGELGATCTEESVTNPLSTYAEYNLIGEELVKQIGGVILRPATAFGVSNRLRQDLLINDFTLKAITTGKLTLFESHFKRTFISVNDLARSFHWSIEYYDDMKDNIWNVGDERLNFSKLEVAHIIKKYINYEIIEDFKLVHDLDKRNYFVNYSKIKSLGFERTETLDDGIKALIKVYKNL